MGVADDIRDLRDSVREVRDDVQAISRQVGSLEKDQALLNASYQAVSKAANEDRTAIRADMGTVKREQDEMKRLLTEHIRSVEAITNQWKGATTVGSLIAKGLFKVFAWACAAGAAVWAAWDQIILIWRAIFR